MQISSISSSQLSADLIALFSVCHTTVCCSRVITFPRLYGQLVRKGEITPSTSKSMWALQRDLSSNPVHLGLAVGPPVPGTSMAAHPGRRAHPLSPGVQGHPMLSGLVTLKSFFGLLNSQPCCIPGSLKKCLLPKH